MTDKDLEKYDPLPCGYCEHGNVKAKSIDADHCVNYECPECGELWAIDRDGDLVE
ncbi:MAG: hypothetical protein JKY45_00245 [Emcibacter sp.]|nr:hypothetical protein [Emcibacter sp.]